MRIVFGGALLVSILLALAAPGLPADRPGPVATIAAETATAPQPTTPSPTATPTVTPTTPPPTATPTTPPPTATATTPPPTATPTTPPPTATPTTTLTPTTTPTIQTIETIPTTTTVPTTPPPTPDDLAATREISVPILMHHYVEPLADDAGPIRTGLTVTPEQFEIRLQFLAERGYQSVSLYDLQYALALGHPLPSDPVIFTFDDGYTGVYTYAFPLMQEYGFTGTVFLVTEFMDEEMPDYLTWEQAEALAAAGWDLESHSRNHPDLKDKPRDFLIYQILGSMQTIQAHAGRRPRYFAYPSGEYDDKVIQILKEVGFWGAVTTRGGYIHHLHDAYTFARVRVSGTETMSDFAARLGLEP